MSAAHRVGCGGCLGAVHDAAVELHVKLYVASSKEAMRGRAKWAFFGGQSMGACPTPLAGD